MRHLICSEALPTGVSRGKPVTRVTHANRALNGSNRIVRMGFVPGRGHFEGSGMIGFAGRIGLRRGFVPKTMCGSGTKPNQLVDWLWERET